VPPAFALTPDVEVAAVFGVPDELAVFAFEVIRGVLGGAARPDVRDLYSEYLSPSLSNTVGSFDLLGALGVGTFGESLAGGVFQLWMLP